MNRVYIGAFANTQMLQFLCELTHCSEQESLVHSDVLYLPGVLTVEQVREIETFAQLQELQLPRKVCVLPDFDTASSIIQNKLLKVVEDGAMDFLIAVSAKNYLLPTLLSRCVCYYTTPRLHPVVEELFQLPHSQWLSYLTDASFYDAHKEQLFAIVKSLKRELLSVLSIFHNPDVSVVSDIHQMIRNTFTITQLVEIVALLDEMQSYESITKHELFVLGIALSSE